MKRPVLVLLTALSCGACVTEYNGEHRSDLIRKMMTSTVQIFDVREDGGNRAASGIVLGPGVKPGQLLILTTKHFLEPATNHDIRVMGPLRRKKVKAEVVAIGADNDMAVLAISGLELTPVKFKNEAQLGDRVWVVAFPWGRRRTVVEGIVSQINWGKKQPAEVLIEGPVSLVDAPVSYGTSGGGVYDAGNGALLGIVRGYRSAELAVPGSDAAVIKIPVAGETTVISTSEILQFLEVQKIKVGN